MKINSKKPFSVLMQSEVLIKNAFSNPSQSHLPFFALQFNCILKDNHFSCMLIFLKYYIYNRLKSNQQLGL